MITEKRYLLQKHLIRNDKIYDWTRNRILNTGDAVNLLNELEEDRRMLKDLKIEYKRVNNVLNDFLELTNRLQANPEDTTLHSIARDMLIMMGVELKEIDSDAK